MSDTVGTTHWKRNNNLYLFSGMRFGLMQTKVGLATIFRNFRVTLSSKTKTPLEMDPRLLIPTTKGGIWLNLEKI